MTDRSTSKSTPHSVAHNTVKSGGGGGGVVGKGGERGGGEK